MTGKKDYDIGYGKPPVSGRFRKGVSGNPGGRPKDSRNLQTDVREVLGAKVAVTENGRKRRVSSQLATLMRLREKALKGDLRAIEKLIDLARELMIEETARRDERSLTVSEADILDRYAAALLEPREAAPQSDSEETAPDDTRT